MRRVVKLTNHSGQYRITLPRDLVVKAGLVGVEYVKLDWGMPGRIVIEEYYGKSKEKGVVPENKA